MIEAMERMGFRVTHLYGLTESYGPATVCAWHEAWDALPLDRARRREWRARACARRCRKALTVRRSGDACAECRPTATTIGEIDVARQHH